MITKGVNVDSIRGNAHTMHMQRENAKNAKAKSSNGVGVAVGGVNVRSSIADREGKSKGNSTSNGDNGRSGSGTAEGDAIQKDVSVEYVQGSNNSSVFELLLAFFQMYVNFPVDSMAVCINSGKTLAKAKLSLDVQDWNSSRWRKSPLCVLDPSNVRNNVARSLREEWWVAIKEEMQRGVELLTLAAKLPDQERQLWSKLHASVTRDSHSGQVITNLTGQTNNQQEHLGDSTSPSMAPYRQPNAQLFDHTPPSSPYFHSHRLSHHEPTPPPSPFYTQNTQSSAFDTHMPNQSMSSNTTASNRAYLNLVGAQGPSVHTSMMAQMNTQTHQMSQLNHTAQPLQQQHVQKPRGGFRWDIINKMPWTNRG